MLASINALQLAANTIGVTWQNCGNSPTVTVTAVEPTQFTLGTTATISGSGNVAAEISGGTWEMTMTGLGGVQLLNNCKGAVSSTPQSCSIAMGPIALGEASYLGLPIPIAAGTLNNVSYASVSLPASLPSFATSVQTQFTASNADGSPLMCVSLSTGDGSTDPKDIAKDRDYPAFESFLAAHRGGGYSSEAELIGRFATFKANMRAAEARDLAASYRKPAHGRKRETHGVTQFMDLTPAEFQKKHTGFQKLGKKTPFPPTPTARPAGWHARINETAASVDWNAKGALSPIKNQGQCGSCWAFSATEQLESQYFQKYGVMKELAPQQIVSCDTSDAGCGGGNPISAWGYVSGFGGQELASAYPYTSGTTQQNGACASEASKVAETVGGGYTMICDSAADEDNMLAQIGTSPMSICVDATLWQTYTGGVITAASGCGTSIDHAVQATGYNAPGNYWIIRNSWGPSWGEQGFVYVEYGANVCGLTYQATTVEVAKV